LRTAPSGMDHVRRMTEKRLQEAESLLRLAESGLRQVGSGNPDRRIPGLRNVLVFGSLFRTAMEKLAARDPLFASWFDQQRLPKEVDELRAATIRKPKERKDYTQVQLASEGKEFGPRPENAIAFFSGDRLGGSGWDVAVGDGRVEKYYVAIPDHTPVADSFGKEGLTAEIVARRYVTLLREMLRHAKIAT
jgi:hypothetical protein